MHWPLLLVQLGSLLPSFHLPDPFPADLPHVPPDGAEKKLNQPKPVTCQIFDREVVRYDDALGAHLKIVGKQAGEVDEMLARAMDALENCSCDHVHDAVRLLARQYLIDFENKSMCNEVCTRASCR